MELTSIAALRVLASLGPRGEQRLAEALPQLRGRAQREASLVLADRKTPEAREAVLQLVATTPDAALQEILLTRIVAATDPQ